MSKFCMYLLFKFWGSWAKAHTQANNIIVFFFSPSTRTTLYSPRLRDFLYKSMSSIGYSYARMRNSPPTKLLCTCEEFSSHKTWEIQIWSKRRKESGNERARLAPLLWPNCMHSYVTIQCCYRRGFLPSILDSSVYR